MTLNSSLFHHWFRLLFGLVFTVSHVAMVEVPGFGNCPRVNIIQNFDLSRFLGRWFEICAYPNKLTMGGRCVFSTYAWNNNGITVYHKHISMGKDKQYLGSATVVSNGVLGITYPAFRNYIFSKESQFFNFICSSYFSKSECIL